MVEFKGLAESFGLSWEFLIAGLPAVVLFTQFCKKVFKLVGYWNLIPAAAIALAISLKSAADPGGVIFGTALLTIFGSGLWQVSKDLAKKVGNSK